MKKLAMAIADITARVPFRMRQEIDEIAHEERLTMGETVRALISYGIAAYRTEHGLDPVAY